MMAFAGQVVAFVGMSCQNQSGTSQESMMDLGEMDPGMINHLGHMAMDASSTVPSGDLECCPDCVCSVGGCATAALPVPSLSFSSYPAPLAKYKASLALSQLAISLFRPPISR